MNKSYKPKLILMLQKTNFEGLHSNSHIVAFPHSLVYIAILTTSQLMSHHNVSTIHFPFIWFCNTTQHPTVTICFVSLLTIHVTFICTPRTKGLRIPILWDMNVSGSQHFEGKCHLHLQGHNVHKQYNTQTPLKIKATHSFKMSGNTVIQHHIPEDYNPQLRCYEDLKTHNYGMSHLISKL